VPVGYSYIVNEGLQGCVCASYAIYTDASGNPGFYTCTGSASSVAIVPKEQVWDGKWHSIVGTYDGASVRVYLDGVLVGSPVAGVAPSYSLSAHSDFRIGHLGGGCGRSFAGDIDEVGVWDGALSDSEIEFIGDCSLFSDAFESGDTSAWSSTVQ